MELHENVKKINLVNEKRWNGVIRIGLRFATRFDHKNKTKVVRGTLETDTRILNLNFHLYEKLIRAALVSM